jgi:hypothetical protein
MGTSNQSNVRSDLDVLEILREGRRLIETGWCQGATAKDSHDAGVDPTSPNAVQFDPLGAIERAVSNLFGGDERYLTQNFYKAFYAFVGELHTHAAIAAWNDDPARLKEHILERFDRALAKSTVPPASKTPKIAA